MTDLTQCKVLIERDGEVYLETPAGNFLLRPGQPENKIMGRICELHAQRKLKWEYTPEKGDIPQRFKTVFGGIVILLSESDELEIVIYRDRRQILRITNSASIRSLHGKLLHTFNAPTKFGDFFPEHRAEIEADRAEGVRIALRFLA